MKEISQYFYHCFSESTVFREDGQFIVTLLVSGKVVTYFGIRHRQQLKLVREFGHCSETLLYCVLRADLGRLKRCLAFFSFQDEVT